MKLNYSGLWEKLKENNMTQTDLQRAIKCSSNTIGKIKREETISMQNLIEICELFGCQITDIVTIENEKS